LETAVKRLYEGLFLVDSAIAAGDWQLVNDTINKILTKAGAEVVSFRKWDERKLTYDIGRVSRGTYILVYFNCDTLRVHEIERDVQLSETLMRVMILRTDRMTADEMEKPTPAMVVETQAAEAADQAEKATEDAIAARAKAVDATDESDDDDDFDDVDDEPSQPL
jgi:ribosomal protein S6